MRNVLHILLFSVYLSWQALIGYSTCRQFPTQKKSRVPCDSSLKVCRSMVTFLFQCKFSFYKQKTLCIQSNASIVPRGFDEGCDGGLCFVSILIIHFFTSREVF